MYNAFICLYYKNQHCFGWQRANWYECLLINLKEISVEWYWFLKKKHKVKNNIKINERLIKGL